MPKLKEYVLRLTNVSYFQKTTKSRSMKCVTDSCYSADKTQSSRVHALENCVFNLQTQRVQITVTGQNINVWFKTQPPAFLRLSGLASQWGFFISFSSTSCTRTVRRLCGTMWSRYKHLSKVRVFRQYNVFSTSSWFFKLRFISNVLTTIFQVASKSWSFYLSTYLISWANCISTLEYEGL